MKSCVKCGSFDIYRKRTRSYFCLKHDRFEGMRNTARSRNKYIPSHQELETLLDVTNGMACIGCNTKMVWTRKENNKKVMTLQHDRDGTLRFLCQSCNARHVGFEEDSFYSNLKLKLFCHRCKEPKTKQDLYPDKRYFTGYTNWCRNCFSKVRYTNMIADKLQNP